MFWDGTSRVLIDLWCLPSILRNLLVENDGIYTLCFNHDGTYLAANSLDREIYVNISPLSVGCILLPCLPDLGNKDKTCTERF